MARQIELGYTYIHSHALPLHGLVISGLTKRGFSVREFADPEVDEARELAALEGVKGLFVDRLFAKHYPRQDAALFDRLAIASQLQVPVFERDGTLTGDLLEPLPHTSANGKRVADVLEGLDVITLSNGYDEINARLGA
jgi:hypothetical protein